MNICVKNMCFSHVFFIFLKALVFTTRLNVNYQIINYRIYMTVYGNKSLNNARESGA